MAARSAGEDREGRRNARLAATALLGVLLAAFSLLNLDEVEVNWVFGTWDSPLLIVILVSMLFGAALGWLARGRDD